MGHRFVGLSHGVHGEKVQSTMNYWEGMRICFQRLYGTGRLPVQRISLGLFSSFVGKEEFHLGRVWWAGGRVVWAGGRVGDFEVLGSILCSPKLKRN